jgi:hypothetical protein
MGTRGRQSAAALTVVGPSGIETVRRPEPPGELTDEQASEWKAIVNRLPADWFGRETHSMLAQYCRHVVAARRVAQLIEACEADEHMNVEDYDRLLKMQEREGRAMSSLATRMRISQQATYDKQKKKPTGITQKPWA